MITMSGGSGSSFIPDTLRLSAYQPSATARKVVQLLPGFSTVDANGQSRPFQTSMVGGTNASSGESVVVTTRSDYELGASGNLLATYDDGALQASRYETGYGYITASGARFYYERDHLGNNRAVVDALGRAVRWTDYFAYGAIRDEWSIGQTRDNYGYTGKELDRETGLNYFGGRYLDALTGVWNSVDPLWSKYPSLSPYVYAADNPTSALDPDGRLVIFINGNHNDGSGGTSSYWFDRLDNGEYVAFDNLIMKHFQDYNSKYIDGALKGFAIMRPDLQSSKHRTDMGFLQGMKDAEEIIAGLKQDENGNIIESIKVVAHSMGAAYAKGYILAIKSYAAYVKKKNLQIIEADFAPFKPLEQSAVEGVPTFQFSNEDDGVASNSLLFSPPGKISGVKDSRFFYEKEKGKGHSLKDFIDKIKNLPEGKYKITNGEIIQE